MLLKRLLPRTHFLAHITRKLFVCPFMNPLYMNAQHLQALRNMTTRFAADRSIRRHMFVLMCSRFPVAILDVRFRQMAIHRVRCGVSALANRTTESIGMNELPVQFVFGDLVKAKTTLVALNDGYTAQVQVLAMHLTRSPAAKLFGAELAAIPSGNREPGLKVGV